MKRVIRKVIACLCCLFILGATFDTFPNLEKSIVVEATSTQEMADYIRGLIGTSAKGNSECPALCKYYVKNFFGKNTNISLGNGNETYKTYPAIFPDVFEQINYYDGFMPQPGDIISYYSGTPKGKKYGHTALVYEVNGSTYKIAEQWARCGTVRSNTKKVMAGVPGVSYTIIGVARPKSTGCDCTESYAGQYIVTTESSNLIMRNSHSTSGSVVTTIPKGTEVKVIKGNGTWAHVEYGGKTGYCSMQYLTPKPEVVEVVPSQPTLTVGAGTSFSKTTFNWSTCDNTNWYDIRIYKSDGTNILTLYNLYTTNYTTPLEEGSYYANIASVNSNGNYTFSSNVSFTVSKGTLTPAAVGTYDGHVYAVYDANTWYTNSEQIAQNTLGGHLVRIESEGENEFVKSLIQSGKYEHYWIGGTDTATEGTFLWNDGSALSSEAWCQNAWAFGEPNNTDDKEDYMEMYKSTGLWNDNANDCDETGFVVEIEEQDVAAEGIYNGNQYEVFEGNLSWTEAKAYCEMLGGHLAYVDSSEENDFVSSLTAKGQEKGYWLGGENLTNSGTYQWTDGTALSYQNWDSNQPDSTNNNEHYLEIWDGGKWNDAPNVEGLGFVCEYENTFSKNVTVSSKTDSEIGISWTGVRYADGYNVYVDGKKFDTTTEVNYTISGLSALTGYEIYVEAVADGKVIGTTGTVSVLTAQEVTFSGQGTASDPYLIATEDDLYCMASMINDPLLNSGFGAKYYQQTNDIAMSGEDYFPSIGNTDAPFRGVYDGNFHTISNFTAVNGGLFGQIGTTGGSDTAIVRNLEIQSDIHEMFSENTGGIAGTLCGNGRIENCAVIGDIDGITNAGGIAGKMQDGSTILNCYHNGAVTAETVSGGIAGVMEGGSISNTYHTTGTVSGTTAGGIVGTIGETGTVQNSFYLKSTAGTSTISGAVAANETVMKELAVTLGDSFASDENSVNDGYPVLIWQNGLYTFEGSGTAEDPYQINSTEDFVQMADYVNSEMFNSNYGNAHYVQNVDIILNDMEWEPIGKNWEVPFSGEYDGNTYSIYGLNAGGSVYGGLFGRVEAEGKTGGYVHNVTVVNGSASCSNSVGKTGGIAAVVAGGAKIESCAFIGTVGGESNVGGVVGMITEGGTVINCYQTGTVEGSSNVGGIVGMTNSGTVEIANSYHAGGTVTASKQYGGVSGGIGNGTKIENCYYLKANVSYGVNSGSNSGAMAVSSSVLKLLADDLGEAYSENVSDYFNEGYPVFEWQDFSKENNPVYGDVNDDGEFTISDVVMLQKWLLCAGDLTNWKNGDLYEDGVLNVFDLALMKCELIHSME